VVDPAVCHQPPQPLVLLPGPGAAVLQHVVLTQVPATRPTPSHESPKRSSRTSTCNMRLVCSPVHLSSVLETELFVTVSTFYKRKIASHFLLVFVTIHSKFVRIHADIQFFAEMV
jgi:hypothetical protein